MQHDPVLKDHITLEFVDRGFYIETKCEGKFTLAWLAEDMMKLSPTLSEPWERIEALNPADPEYFQKLEKMCRNWHNTYCAIYAYGCKVKM